MYDAGPLIYSKPVRVRAADESDVIWAAALARRVYTGADVIPESLMLEWFGANPGGFSVLCDAEGERVGNVDLLPLRAEAMARIRNGSGIELEIRGADLFGARERGLVRDVYVESVVARAADLQRVDGGAEAVLRSFSELLARVGDLRALQNVYAIAASRGGERFLKRLGMERVMEGAERRDGHDLFGGSVVASGGSSGAASI